MRAAWKEVQESRLLARRAPGVRRYSTEWLAAVDWYVRSSETRTRRHRLEKEAPFIRRQLQACEPLDTGSMLGVLRVRGSSAPAPAPLPSAPSGAASSGGFGSSFWHSEVPL